MLANAKSHKHSQKSAIFKDLCILILPVAIGRKRITLFETQIKKEGGTVCSVNEVKSGKVSPSHIVVEDSLFQNQNSYEKHIGSLKDKGIIVCTQWLSDSLKWQKCMASKDYQFKVDVIQESLTAGGDDCSPAKKQKLSSDLRPEDTTSHSKSTDIETFACSQSSSSKNKATERNALIIQELQKLADAFRIKGDTWRSYGYTKAISAIKRCGKVLESYEDAIALPGVGDKMASKVWEILETGSLRKVSEVCSDEKTRTLELFTNIWGVGPSTADSWYQQGCRSLNDVRDKVSLSKQQQIGLKHYEDFLERIPRYEVEEVERIVSTEAKAIEPLLSTILVGSYRRGKSTCGDIDIMVIKPDSLNSKDILSQILLSLKNRGLVTDDLVSMEKEGNQRKYLGVCKLPGWKHKA
ncbi:hypothetical protein ONE63_009435 [Megalurothrips usitatus]|uniref:DNA polymerase n=1 Tax=Megalurothrips usitatus TaxID=439358 RepID=A0AAV7XRG1_9NEOP|nr:hypothetical protein ONE63_009435 [Megalurothrips usitatus]